MATLNFPSDPSTQNPVNTYSPDSTPLASENGVTYVWDGEKWTASTSGGNLDDIYVNVDGDVMTGDLTVPSLNGGPLAGLRNQLINGDFRVWQRGDGPVRNTNLNKTYGPDRFFVSTSGVQELSKVTSSYTGEPFDYALRVEKISGSDDPTLRQDIEGNPFAAGQTYTLSFVSDKDPSNALIRTSPGNETISTNSFTKEDLGGGWNRYSAQFLITSAFGNSNTDYVELVVTTSETRVIFSKIQLEPGPVATPFEHRPIGLELQLCQRYYTKGDFWMQSGGSTITNIGSKVYFPSNMRATPVGTFSQTRGTNGGVFYSKQDSMGIAGVPDGSGDLMGTYTADAEL